MVRNIVRLEGLMVLLLSLYTYQYVHGNWILFLLLLITPDISMIGYLRDKKSGAIIYNLFHNYVIALALIFAGFFYHNFLLDLGLILLAHVGMDRFFGFGLKYPTDFKNTHMQKL